MKRVVIILLAAALAVALFACTPQGEERTLEAVTFTVIVIAQDGEAEALPVTTYYTYLVDALLEIDLIEGEESAMGLMVTHVNGIRADFVQDGAWWQVFVDGEPSMVGISSIRVEPDTTYTFEFTPA